MYCRPLLFLSVASHYAVYTCSHLTVPCLRGFFHPFDGHALWASPPVEGSEAAAGNLIRLHRLEEDQGLWLQHNSLHHSSLRGRDPEDVCDTLPELSVLFFWFVSFFFLHLLCFSSPYFLLSQSSSQRASGCEGPRCFLISDIIFTLSTLTSESQQGNMMTLLYHLLGWVKGLPQKVVKWVML